MAVGLSREGQLLLSINDRRTRDMPGLPASSSLTGGSKTVVFAELGERRTTIHLSLGSPTWCHQQSLFQCAKSLTLNISEPGRRQRPRPDPHPRPTLLTKTPSSFFAGSWQETWQHRYRDTSCQAKVTQSRLLKRSDHQRRRQDSLTSVLRQQNPRCLLCTAPPVLNTSVGFPENHTPATMGGGGTAPSQLLSGRNEDSSHFLLFWASLWF